MNRYGMIDRISDRCIRAIRNNTNAGWKQVILQGIVTKNKNTKLLCNDTGLKSFFSDHSLDASTIESEEDLYIIAGELHDFLQQAGPLQDYNSGDRLLKYYMYYKYAEKNPVKALKVDKEFKTYKIKFEKEVRSRVDKWISTLGKYVSIWKCSFECKVLLYVFNRANVTYPMNDLSLSYIYKTYNVLYTPTNAAVATANWYNRLLSEEDKVLLQETYPDNFSGEVFYYSVMQELYRALSKYMSREVIRSTPIIVSCLYYIYICTNSKFELRNMHTESQGVRATNIVNKLCSTYNRQTRLKTVDMDYIKVLKIYDVNTNVDAATSVLNVELANNIYNILVRDKSTQMSIKSCKLMAIEVSNRLEKFKRDMEEKELVSCYNTSEMLSAYIYYNCRQNVVKDYMGSGTIKDIVYKERQLLPEAHQELSDIAVLLLLIFRQTDKSYVDYYSHIDFSELISEYDENIISDSYGDIGDFYKTVRMNLSRITDVYMVTRPGEEHPIQIVTRCTSILYSNLTLY